MNSVTSSVSGVQTKCVPDPSSEQKCVTAPSRACDQALSSVTAMVSELDSLPDGINVSENDNLPDMRCVSEQDSLPDGRSVSEQDNLPRSVSEQDS